MRAKATLYHLQQVTHLRTHFADRALRTLKAGGPLSFPSSFYIFFFQLLLSSLSSPTGAETEQEWRPFAPAIPTTRRRAWSGEARLPPRRSSHDPASAGSIRRGGASSTTRARAPPHACEGKRRRPASTSMRSSTRRWRPSIQGRDEGSAVPLLDQVALSGSPSPSWRESTAAGRIGEGKGLLP
jgi:hypothetical protein